MRAPMKKLFVFGLVSSMLVLGCELIVDFDRTKIVGEEVPETGASDSAVIDSAGGGDSASDATSEAATDSGTDATDAADDVADASDSG